MLSEAGRQNFFKKSFEKPLTKPPRCDILIVSRGQGKPKGEAVAANAAKGFKSRRGRSEKKFPKPLDKLPKMWYNKNVPRGQDKKERGNESWKR